MTGDSLKELKLSEQGSIQTEDFEAKFHEMCIQPVAKPTGNTHLIAQMCIIYATLSVYILFLYLFSYHLFVKYFSKIYYLTV